MKKVCGGTGVSPVQAARGAAEKASEYEEQRQDQKQQRRAGAPAPHFPDAGVKL
jgi:hypothetical protein